MPVDGIVTDDANIATVLLKERLNATQPQTISI